MSQFKPGDFIYHFSAESYGVVLDVTDVLYFEVIEDISGVYSKGFKTWWGLDARMMTEEEKSRLL
jgi:hypothetical protein